MYPFRTPDHWCLKSGEATGHSLALCLLRGCANAWLEACVPAQESVPVPRGRGQPLHGRLDAPQDTGSQGFSPGQFSTGVACGLEPVCSALVCEVVLTLIKVSRDLRRPTKPAQSISSPSALWGAAGWG